MIKTKYLVTMEMIESLLTNILTSPQQSITHVEQVLKQHEILIKLEVENKIHIVGTPVGKKIDMFIVDTPSHEELNELIMSLPNHAKMNINVIPLVGFKIQDVKIRQNLERLKAAQK